MLLLLLAPALPLASAKTHAPGDIGACPAEVETWPAHADACFAQEALREPDVAGLGASEAVGTPAAGPAPAATGIPGIPGPVVEPIAGEPEPPVPDDEPLVAESISQGTGFEGAPDNGAVPADASGAVSTTHAVTSVNGALRIHTRAGSLVSTETLNTFWTVSGTFDPRTVYDPYGGRFITAVLAGPPATRQFGIAASTGGGPTGSGSFHRYIFTFDATGACTPDYTTVGFTKDWIIVSWKILEVSGLCPWADAPSSTGVQILAFEKAKVYAGQPVGYWSWNLPHTTICGGSCDHPVMPATTLDSTLATVYLVNEYNRDAGQLHIRTITGPISAPVLSVPLTVTGSSTWGSPPHVPQQGTTSILDTRGTKIDTAIYRNGALWVSQTVGLSSPSRASAQWWQINPTTGSVTQFGRVDDTTGKHRIYASLAVNSNNDVLLGYTLTSSSMYPSAAYAWRHGNTPLNTMHSIDVVSKAGLGPYTAGGATNPRWADYSATVVDPVNDRDMWTLQEYSTADNHWVAWWTPVVFTTSPSNDYFEDSTLVPSVPHTATRSTVGATAESGEPAPCGGIGSTVWYHYTPTSSGTITIDTATSSYDTVLAAYTGSSVTGLSNVACNDDSGGLQSQISFSATGGTTYRIQAGGFSAATGNLVLHVNCSPNNCVTSAPSAPQNVLASAGPGVGQIRTTWSAPASNGGSAITAYSVYRATSCSGTFSFIASVGASTFSYTDGGLGNGVFRCYKVSASNSIGEGPRSAGSGATTWSLPGAPQSVTATAGPSVGQIRTTWSAPASNGGTAITAYSVYRATSCSGTFSFIASVGASTFSYTDGGLGNGVFRCYKVSATNAVGEGPQSAGSGATTWNTPSAPQSPSATPGPGLQEIRVCWSAPASNGGTAVTSYQVYRSTNGGGSYSFLASTGSTCYTDSGLTLLSTYYYRVSAVNAVGEGPQSSAVCAKPYPSPGGC